MCNKTAEFVLYHRPVFDFTPSDDDAIGRFCTAHSVEEIKERNPHPIIVFCLNPNPAGFECERTDEHDNLAVKVSETLAVQLAANQYVKDHMPIFGVCETYGYHAFVAGMRRAQEIGRQRGVLFSLIPKDES